MRDSPDAGARGQGDDGLAALRERRAADEVHLPADAGVLQVADRVGADLPGEVHLEAPLMAVTFGFRRMTAVSFT